jgi:hypothetical protein
MSWLHCRPELLHYQGTMAGLSRRWADSWLIRACWCPRVCRPCNSSSPQASIGLQKGVDSPWQSFFAPQFRLGLRTGSSKPLTQHARMESPKGVASPRAMESMPQCAPLPSLSPLTGELKGVFLRALHAPANSRQSNEDEQMEYQEGAPSTGESICMCCVPTSCPPHMQAP